MFENTVLFTNKLKPFSHKNISKSNWYRPDQYYFQIHNNNI